MLRLRRCGSFRGWCGRLGGSRCLDGSFCLAVRDEDVDERAVHRTAHDLREEESRSTDDTTDSDEEDVANGHTSDSTSHTAQRVEQADGDRHVSTAHTYGEVKPEERTEEHRADHSVDEGIRHLVVERANE